jgi:hypothetical protein
MPEIQLTAINRDKRNCGGAERVLCCLVRSIEAVENDKLTDEHFIQAIEAAQKQFPELFDDLNHDALAEAMGAAVVNSPVKGALKRKLK